MSAIASFLPTDVFSTLMTVSTMAAGAMRVKGNSTRYFRENDPDFRCPGRRGAMLGPWMPTCFRCAHDRFRHARSPEREFWERRYAEPAYAYGTEPNGFLVEVAGRMPPGPVLCLAEGEGRNAVWLAGRGHAVTAVDASAAGLAKAEALARARGVRDRDDRRRSRVLRHRARRLVGDRRDLRPPAAAAAPLGPPRRRPRAGARRRLRPRGVHAAAARARDRRPAAAGVALQPRGPSGGPGRPGPGDRPRGRARRAWKGSTTPARRGGPGAGAACAGRTLRITRRRRDQRSSFGAAGSSPPR